MTQILIENKPNKALFFIYGLIGISILIIIHELGHFLAAHLFNIPTPTFSIGFGPALLKIPIGSTIFQIALLPFGGYVEINQEILAQQPYFHKMVVILAGIVFNIIFTFIIMMYYSYNKTTKSASFKSCLEYIHTQNPELRGIIGPIGLIHLIGKSFTINKQLFWLILALISFNIALFNLLPLPFLDGGQLFIFTLQALMGKHFPATAMSIISFILFVGFMLFVSLISINDIKNVR